jgi:hypothetical protein
MAQVAEHLPSKPKSLSSNTRTALKKKRKRKRKKIPRGVTTVKLKRTKSIKKKANYQEGLKLALYKWLIST